MSKTKEAAELLKFSISKNALKKELDFIQNVVEKKSTIPILQNLLIESTDEGKIRITGTNLDVTLRCETEANIATPGAIRINTKKLCDIVRTVKCDEINFTKEENHWVKLTCGKSKFRLAGMESGSFPETPSAGAMPLNLSAELFSHFINNTAFAITNIQNRFQLSGAKFMVGSDFARMIATDGHRLALAEKQIDAALPGTDTIDTLVPKIALTSLSKILGNPEAMIAFGEDTNHIFFETENRLIVARKLVGTFPNYEMIFPKDNDKLAKFDIQTMRDAVHCVGLMTESAISSIKLTVRPGEILIEARSSEDGEASEIVPVEYDGEEVAIGFNYKYLTETLGLPVMNAGKTSMSFKDSTWIVNFTTDNDAGFQSPIMPVRL